MWEVWKVFYVMQNMKDTEANWPKTEYFVRAVRKRDDKVMRIPVLSTNILVTGTTGYGKTVFTKEYVSGVLQENPGTFAVFFQIKPDDFTDEFLYPGDKIVTFYDGIYPTGNLFKWCMVKEIRSRAKSMWETELEELTSILFADILNDPRNIVWAGGAKDFFKGFLRVVLYCYKNNPSNREIISAMSKMSWIEMLQFLWKYPPNRSMLKDNFEYDISLGDNYKLNKKGSDIAFFLQYIKGKFGGSFMSEDGEDTIYDYMHGKYGTRLFILHDHKARESSKLFERYFLKYIGDEMLSATSDFHGKMLWVLDEIDKIGGYDFGLIEAVTLGRQYNLQVIVSTQSLNSLYAIAPEKYGKECMNGALAGFPMTVTFHPGDPHTIETLQELYGKEVIGTVTMPLSRYDKPMMITEQRYIVEDSDFASLDTGECYIKYRSEKPERVKIIV